MDNFAVILMVTSAALVTAAACLVSFIVSRRQMSNISSFKYPVPEEKAPAPMEKILEEAAAVYNVAARKEGEIMERFKAMMAEKPYLKGKLRIETVAARLGTNKTTLSRMVNDKFGMNFRQLLNSYRVKEAIDLFSNNHNISMEELRNGAGFKSVSTFTSSFTRFTGCTPAEYCKKASGK